MKSITILGAGAVAISLLSTQVQAVPITVNWEGTMNVSRTQTLPSEIAGRIHHGDTITGSFIFDSEAAFTPSMSFGYNPGGDGVTIAHYLHTPGIYGFNATINNDISFGSSASSELMVQVINDRSMMSSVIDRFGIWSRGDNTNFSGTSISPNFQMFFTDYSATAFDSLSLPGMPLDLSMFSLSAGEISLNTPGQESFFTTFSVNNLWVESSVKPSTSVPEPSSLALLIAGIGFAASRRLRSK